MTTNKNTTIPTRRSTLGDFHPFRHHGHATLYSDAARPQVPKRASAGPRNWLPESCGMSKTEIRQLVIDQIG